MYWRQARQIIIRGDGSNKPYGLQCEVAWNYVSLCDFTDSSILNVISSYHFQNQIVADFDRSPQQFVSAQSQEQVMSKVSRPRLTLNSVEGLDIRLAYRYNDVKTTYSGNTLANPWYHPQGLAIQAIPTKSGWRFGYTISWQSSRGIRSTESNQKPIVYLPGRMPIGLSNAPSNKGLWSKRFEVYFGGKISLLSRQPDPIIGAGDPYGNYVDASLGWGPVFWSHVVWQFQGITDWMKSGKIKKTSKGVERLQCLKIFM